MTFWARDNPALLLVKSANQLPISDAYRQLRDNHGGAATTASEQLIGTLRRQCPTDILAAPNIPNRSARNHAARSERRHIFDSTLVHTLHFSTAARLGLIHGACSLFHRFSHATKTSAHILHSFLMAKDSLTLCGRRSFEWAF